MAARDGMANLILRLRAMCNVGTADYSIAGTTYWIGDQLEDRLDHHRTEHRNIVLTATPYPTNGSFTYTEYRLPVDIRDVEEADSGYWRVFSTLGVDQTVNEDYTVNYESGIITFTADTGGDNFLLDATMFDLYRAAAEVWDDKSGHYGLMVDWSSDNHSIKASQKREQAEKMADYFRKLAGPKVSRLVRLDEIRR